MAFNTKLKKLRTERNLSQTELCTALEKKGINLSKSAISMYENGNREPNIDMLMNLSIFFGIRIDELLDIDSGKYFDNQDDYEFYKEIKDSLHPTEKLSEDIYAYKKYINQYGYDIMRTHETYYFSGKSFNTVITDEELENLMDASGDSIKTIIQAFLYNKHKANMKDTPNIRIEMQKEDY